MNFLLETLRLGLTNLRLHKMRSFLTALGIIFGVAAVIWMVAIGEGNKIKALRDIEDLGATNIIVRSEKPAESGSAAQATQRLVSYGIQRADMRRIAETVAAVDRIVPLKRVGSRAVNGPHQASAATFGTVPELIEVASLHVERGRYLQRDDMDKLANVAVLGAEAARRLFPLRDPLGEQFRVEEQVFTVVGLLRPIGLGRDLNFDIHIPLTTAESRFGDILITRAAGSMERERVELHELYISVANPDDVIMVGEQVKLALDFTHAQQQDVVVTVPLELLNQRRRAMFMFNALMICIAAISLFIGGIGIMNIMLASVTDARDRHSQGAWRHTAAHCGAISRGNDDFVSGGRNGGRGIWAFGRAGDGFTAKARQRSV
jgi:putative ABC transport system permease protein